MEFFLFCCNIKMTLSIPAQYDFNMNRNTEESFFLYLFCQSRTTLVEHKCTFYMEIGNGYLQKMCVRHLI